VRESYSARLPRQYRSFGVVIHCAIRVMPGSDGPLEGNRYRRRAVTWAAVELEHSSA
jgi:hypothetical protein